MAIVPALNEVATIGTVVEQVSPYVGAVIVVDDGSTDGTGSRACAAGAVVISLSRARGYSHAVRMGLLAARFRDFTTFVTLDADGAHDPVDVRALLRCHHTHAYDLTIGDRFANAGSWEIPSTKRWANVFAAGLVNHLFGTHLSDVACGLRAFGPRLADRILSARVVPGFALPYQEIILARREGLRIGTTPVGVRYDASELHCTAANEIYDLFSVCRANVRAARERRRIDAMRSAIRRGHPLTVRVQGHIICLHPISGRSSYVFQLQHPFFAARQILDLNGDPEQ